MRYRDIPVRTQNNMAKPPSGIDPPVRYTSCPPCCRAMDDEQIEAVIAHEGHVVPDPWTWYVGSSDRHAELLSIQKFVTEQSPDLGASGQRSHVL